MVNKCVMSITLNLLATAADSAPYVNMAAGSDPEAVEDPVATGDVKSQSQPSNHTPANLHHSHYIGLPYQDHNYGAPPPPTPPASPPPKLRPVSPSNKLNGFLENSLSTSTLSTTTNADDGITRCICNFEHDDGYMISCDKCFSWQHVECMGLDRNNIPDRYFCERCQPRPIDVQKAIALQTKKRENLSGNLLDDSSSTDSEESNAVNPTTYTAISNSPTRLTLTTHHKNKKSKKKKRKREHSERSHKKKKKKHDKKSRSRSLSSELNLFDEDAQAAWLQSGDSDEYEDISKNEYTTELQKYIATIKPDIGCTIPNNRMRANVSDIGTVNIGRKGLIAKERIAEQQTIIEYHGKVMFKKQLLAQNTFFKGAFYRYMLFYTHFGNVDICVDARVCGNKARYVRRSCSPNAKVLHTTEGDLIRFFLVSNKEIPKDSEITISFDFNHKECSFSVDCACGKKSCSIKKFHKHRHDSDGKKKNQKNNHIKKEDSNSCGTHSAPVSARRRTVSPLRVSLSNQLVQNSVIEDVTPAKMTEEESQTEVDVETEENHPESNRKLTREERKMEAIMKAFEKMEKTQKRRQQALDRLAIAKDNDSQQVKAKVSEDETATAAETNQVIQVDQSNEETSTTSIPQGSETQANLVTKPPVVKRRKKRYNSTPRRRTRNNSAASTISTEIKPLEQSMPSVSTAPVNVSAPPFLASNSSPARTHNVPIHNNNNNDRLLPLLPLVSPVTCNSKHFKFPKTKKLFLNEWLNEKAQEACVDNPLSISTDLVDIVDSASPNSYAHSLARSNSLSALAGKSGLEASLGSAKKRWLRLAMNEAGGSGGGDSPVGMGALSPIGISAGSAISPKSDTITPLKKRWLRTSANDEQLGAAGSTATSASSSPLHPSSENESVLPSTSTILGIDTKLGVTESIESTLLTTATSSSLLVQNSEEIPMDEQKSKETCLEVIDEIVNSIEPKQEENPEVKNPIQQTLTLTSSTQGIYDGCEPSRPLAQGHQEGREPFRPLAQGHQEGSEPFRPLALPLPAKKDCRKNSSIDSGLSVTTPMDISESPKYFPMDNVHHIDQNKNISSSDKSAATLPVDGRTSVQPEPALSNELLTENKPSAEAVLLHSKSDQNRPNGPRLLISEGITGPLEDSRAPAIAELDKSLSSTISSIETGAASQTDFNRSISSLSELQQSWSSVSEYAQSGNSVKIMDKNHTDSVDKEIMLDVPERVRHISDSSGGNCPNTVRTLNFESPQKIGPDSARSSIEDQTGDPPQSYTSPKKRALLFMRESENLTRFSAGWRDSVSDQQTSECENKTQDSILGDKNDNVKPEISTVAGIASSHVSTYPGASVIVNSGSPSSDYINNSISAAVPQPSGSVSLNSGPAAPKPDLSLNSGMTAQSSLLYPVGTQPLVSVGVPPVGGVGVPPLGGIVTPPVLPASGLIPSDGAPVTPPATSPATTPAVKKKVSLLEYRKRKTTAKPSSSSSEPSTPIKSLTSSLSKSSENTPVKMPATLPTLPLFDTPPPVEKDMTGKGLRLSSEAERAISSFTSLLKDNGSKSDTESKRSSSVPESAVSQYKGLSEKMSRIGPNHNLKRSRSPEPPPPPPNKKHNLQLHIPPPPPPKTKPDSRVFNSTDSTPPPPFGRQNSYQASPVASAATRNPAVMQIYPQQAQYHASTSSSSSSPRGHQTSLSYPVQPAHPSQANSNQPYLGYHEKATPAPKHQPQPSPQQYYSDGYQLYPQQTTNVAAQGAPQGVNYQQQQRPQPTKPVFPKQPYSHSYSPRRGFYKSQ